MCKTDPGKGMSLGIGIGNYEMRNFWFHHNYTHDTDCEGCYIGYLAGDHSSVVYGGETISFKNLNDEDVTYVNGETYTMAPHKFKDLMFYRKSV